MLRKNFLLMGFVILALLLASCGGNNNTANNSSNTPVVDEGNNAGDNAGNDSQGEDVTLDDGEPINIPISGQAAGGLLSMVGETVNEMIRREYPGSSVTYEPGNMVGGLVEIAEGNRFPITLGISPIAVEFALQGKAPFDKSFEREDFQMVATITENMQGHVVATKEFVEEYNIKTVADIKTNQVPVVLATNQPGNLQEQSIATDIIEGHGFTREDIAAWGGKVLDIPFSSSFEQMKNGQVDVVILNAWPPDNNIMETSRVKDLTLIPMDAEVVDEIANRYTLSKITIPAGAYDFYDEAYETFGLDLFILAGHLADEKLTYKMAKAIYNHFEYYQSVHPLFKQFNPEMLSKKTGLSIHPGAEKFYKEVGLIE